MSGWMGKLKDILGSIKVNGVKIFSDIKISNLINIHITNKQESHSSDSRTVINLEELDPKTRKQILKILPIALESGTPILEEGVKQTGEDYIKTSENKDFKESINFFKGKIPDTDLKILKASYYLKHLLKEKKPTQETKEGIVKIHGNKGNSISNLCTAGYFESYIRPLYETMSSAPSFEREKFLKVYEDIIENAPFALFVRKNATEALIEKEISDKIKTMDKYGITTLNIHGIGRQKIKAIRVALENIEQSGKATFEQSMALEGNILVVKLTGVKITSSE